MELPDPWPRLIGAWTLVGAADSATVTPGGRLLRRSAGMESRPALFASFAGMAVLGFAGAMLACFVWPPRDPDVAAHSHPELPPDHPHLLPGHGPDKPEHAFVIDDLHPNWPHRM